MAEGKARTVKVTNTATGDRGFTPASTNKEVMVSPGQTVEMDLTDSEVDLLKGSGLEIGAEAAKAAAKASEAPKPE
jgi:hypothetical protein